jgi:hypothetical protein
LKLRLKDLQAEYNKVFNEREQLFKKYNNVDISEIYSKFRIYQTKCEYLQRKMDKEIKTARKYRKRHEKLKFSINAGEYFRLIGSKSRKVSL